jgi:hypothetical protein
MEENSGNTHIFGPVQCVRRFHLLLKFLHFVGNEMMRPLAVPKDYINSNLYWII